MSNPKTPTQITMNELSLVWQVLWNKVTGNPVTMTRHDLQLELGSPIPPDTTLGCLRTFQDENLIKCIRDDSVIQSPFKESDFDQFCLTARGTKKGPLYQGPG